MEEIIKKVCRFMGYEISNRNITILYYAADAVLFAVNEDHLKRLLYLFICEAKFLNMVISGSKIAPRHLKYLSDAKFMSMIILYSKK